MHHLNNYMNSKLEINPLLTVPDLYRSFHRSLVIVEKNEAVSYPKYIVDYAKKLKITVKDQVSKSKALDNIKNAITKKHKRDSNDDCENELNEEMVQENYATSAKEPNNNFAILSFSIKKSIIEKLKVNPVLSYVTDCESIM
ncbi:6677_t:CDS:2 [Funneliformis mosseae]|uniref:6677_t:CDS:1 n=1 Tax=Funneliformis mosseae TaxID=27381 RepID=A0A9N9CEP7_FUNMO|nr:6677_t:CDS:2 [Funneliformis mosseae]